ncbi:MAG: hypothetical protein IJS91_05715 [Bacteroidales bacterium]|nr:hypothetical protein [Bacteroidales bacterium]
MKPYLNELRLLFSCGFAEDDILSLNESEAILKKKAQKRRCLVFECVLPFSKREEAKQILRTFDFPVNLPYYLWVEYADTCGLAMISSLEPFNWDFDWDIDSNGIFSFTDIYIKREIVFDFYEDEDNGQQVLRIALSALE